MKKIVTEVPLVLILVGISNFYSILMLDFVQVIFKLMVLQDIKGLV
jgi:hypothetical protein